MAQLWMKEQNKSVCYIFLKKKILTVTEKYFFIVLVV